MQSITQGERQSSKPFDEQVMFFESKFQNGHISGTQVAHGKVTSGSSVEETDASFSNAPLATSDIDDVNNSSSTVATTTVTANSSSASTANNDIGGGVAGGTLKRHQQQHSSPEPSTNPQPPPPPDPTGKPTSQTGGNNGALDSSIVPGELTLLNSHWNDVG